MLTAAGVAHEAVPAHLDERVVEAGLGSATADEIALALARAKAMAVSAIHPGAMVLGSDSLVEVEGRRFDKPINRDDAASHLRLFSGKVMHLHSAAALVCGGKVIWCGARLARLRVRTLSEDFIASYLEREWPAVGACVGVFRIEGLGVQLFDEIEGDQFTVLGMPLLGVLDALRELGELPR